MTDDYLDAANALLREFRCVRKRLTPICILVKKKALFHVISGALKELKLVYDSFYKLYVSLLIDIIKKAGYTDTEILIDSECKDREKKFHEFLGIYYEERHKYLLRACNMVRHDVANSDKSYAINLFNAMVDFRTESEKIIQEMEIYSKLALQNVKSACNS